MEEIGFKVKVHYHWASVAYRKIHLQHSEEVYICWNFNIQKFIGGFRMGSRGSLEPPSGPKLFYFHGEFQEKCVKLGIRTPSSESLDPPLSEIVPHDS